MKRLFLIIFLIISIDSFSQSSEIEKLEQTLTYHQSKEEHYGVKHGKAYKLLSLDRYNRAAIEYLLRSYQHTGHTDSISLFFDSFIEKNPKEIEPFLIREQYYNYENPSDNERLNNLKNALKIQPKDQRINYLIGKLYYNLFNKEFNNEANKENLDFYSLSSIQHFDTASENNKYKEALSFPLTQLSNYLGDMDKLRLYKSYNVQISYFPLNAFVNLPKNWETDYSVNVMRFPNTNYQMAGVESAIFRLNWYSKHLNALDEPALNDSLPTEIFRFTYLRTFHHPIVIGLENNNGVITIYWKISDGAGGYEPGKIIENQSKELAVEDWKSIEKTIETINFWDLTTFSNDRLLGTDGSQWILEGKHLGKYHVVNRWRGGEIISVCKDLIALTDLEIDKLY